MAAIDRYRMKDGSDDYIADNSSDIHKSKRNGEDFGYIDFKKATRGEIQAYYQGIVDKMVMDRDFKNNNQAEQNTSLAVNDDSVGNINLQGKEKSSEKVITLSNGHSILPTDNSYPGNMGGFTDRLLISLLAGFGLGVITIGVYIFIYLGKFTFHL